MTTKDPHGLIPRVSHSVNKKRAMCGTSYRLFFCCAGQPQGVFDMATVAEIDTAIAAITESGQSFVLDGIQYTAGNLKTLWQMRNELTDESARATGARPTFRGIKLSSMGY